MKKRNTLRLLTEDASLDLSADAQAITMQATQMKPGFFNEHVRVEVGHADAVRLYLWLGEVVGKGEG